MESQINAVAILADEGTWHPDTASSLFAPAKVLFNVERRDIRKCQVLSDVTRYTDLVDSQIKQIRPSLLAILKECM